MTKQLNRLLLLLLFTLTIFSCQDDVNEIATGGQQLDRNSAVTGKIVTITTNNTAIDNVLDSTSCYSVRLPVRVRLNGSENFELDSQEDYASVAQILQSAPAVRSLEFQYPITLLDSAYTPTIVTSDAQLNALTGDCTPAPPASCLTFIYPIRIVTYDTATQTPSSITLDNDMEFFLTLFDLQQGAVYEIEYPLSVVNGVGQIQEITSNEGLSSAIDQATLDCDCDNPQILTEGLISYLPMANQLVDLTGFGQVSLLGDIEFVTDRSNNPGGAVLLSPTAQSAGFSLSGNSNNNLLQNDAFTVSLWFNRQTAALTVEELFSTTDLTIGLGSPFQPSEIRAPFVSTPNIEFLTDESWLSQDGFLLEVNQWHHVAVVWDGQVLSLYRDGQFRSEAISPGFSSAISDMRFAELFNGFLDDIRIYNRALNNNEINTLFNLEGDINTCL